MLRLLMILSTGLCALTAATAPLTLPLQSRPSEGQSPVVQVREAEWDPRQTAMVVCDMWDEHWCKGATARVAELAPAMDKTLRAAREAGVLIIHAPSSTMGFYADTPQRAKAQNAPHAEMPTKDRWRHLIPEKEGPLPIDDSDEGCDCSPVCKLPKKSPWTRQIAAIHIGDEDAISDDGQEVYNLLKAEGREKVIVMGVHTNMCVLGRPFSIRALVSNGFNVALMRDHTDTMYNSRSKPYVNHHRGTDLVVAHIERHWCPTITSSVFTGAPPFRFSDDPRTHAALLIAEDEYELATTLPAFAETALAGESQWRCNYVFGNDEDVLMGHEAIDASDVMIVAMRRKLLPPEQVAAIQAHCNAGKPVVGIRTASHAFLNRDGSVPDGRAAWPEFDRDILGGNYHNHHGNKGPKAPRTVVWVPEEVDHPILEGVRREPHETASWLYKTAPLGENTTVLMMGKVADRTPHEPVTWINHTRDGSRVFYTSLGHPEEFANEDFQRLLANGIRWTVDTETGATE
jgi:type 1 glutamine amidotransferase/nicotinamidase-related amidase